MIKTKIMRRRENKTNFADVLCISVLFFLYFLCQICQKSIIKIQQRAIEYIMVNVLLFLKTKKMYHYENSITV